MTAGWIENHPGFNSFSMDNTTSQALAMMVFFTYYGSLPTLKEVIKRWPECRPRVGLRQIPLATGPKFDFLEFTTYVQAYSLAVRDVVPQFQLIMEEAA